ncbi:hypothetical protein RND81_11G193400 [Saponaria officinalis]|uniref:Reverse transcriptase domain-containing protein n=1 Tax=Saponaria officinalis TaxID=3572 RepID=A0AAW1HP48_SAPOF
MQLNELDEFRLHAYDSARMYKERTKKWHDRHLLHKDFKVGDKVLLFNSRLRLFSGKLKSRWSGPFTVIAVNKFGSITLVTNKGENFKVNGQRLKLYHECFFIGVVESIEFAPGPID